MARRHHHPVSAKGRRERRRDGGGAAGQRGGGVRGAAARAETSSGGDGGDLTARSLPLRLYSGDLHLQIRYAPPLSHGMQSRGRQLRMFGGPPKMACVMEGLLERCFSPPCAKKEIEDRIEELLGCSKESPVQIIMGSDDGRNTSGNVFAGMDRYVFL
uniref:Uncharacterized protein n=1 Tax=Oryza rufipogon TaxID=4529 RepID=A0A0E0NJN0_ORYRU